MSLPDPFPSSPHRSPVASITAILHFNGEEHARTHSVSFAELYAARVWLDVMMGDESAIRTGPTMTLETSGIKLRSYELQAILDYKLNADEQRYRLPHEMVRMIARFRRGSWDLPVEGTIVTTAATITRTRTRNVKERSVMERVDRPADFVTIGELCKGTAIKPMNARALLRAAGYAKPAFGWAFGHHQLRDVRKLIGLI